MDNFYHDGLRGIHAALSALNQAMEETNPDPPSSHQQFAEHLKQMGFLLDALPSGTGPIGPNEIHRELQDVDLTLINLLRFHPRAPDAVTRAEETLHAATGEDMPAIWGNSAAAVMHRFAATSLGE